MLLLFSFPPLHLPPPTAPFVCLMPPPLPSLSEEQSTPHRFHGPDRLPAQNRIIHLCARLLNSRLRSQHLPVEEPRPRPRWRDKDISSRRTFFRPSVCSPALASLSRPRGRFVPMVFGELSSPKKLNADPSALKSSRTQPAISPFSISPPLPPSPGLLELPG